MQRKRKQANGILQFVFLTDAPSPCALSQLADKPKHKHCICKDGLNGRDSSDRLNNAGTKRRRAHCSTPSPNSLSN